MVLGLSVGLACAMLALVVLMVVLLSTHKQRGKDKRT